MSEEPPTLPQAAVAELACKGERHVGTLSGGMDQAISILGELGLAKLIDFNPVRATDVPLPQVTGCSRAQR